MNSKYPNLLSPGTIGSLEIRNKTVMCAMGMSQSDQGFVNQAVINHYAERAKGGIGLIMVEVILCGCAGWSEYLPHAGH